MGTDVEKRKRELRAECKKRLSVFDSGERDRLDRAIHNVVVALDCFGEADVVLTYLSMGAEVQTRGIIQTAWELGKKVAIPHCVPHTRDMCWHSIDSFEGLHRTSFGVDEPTDNPRTRLVPCEHAHVIAIVPGLTFDRHGFRVGYGGGYYDTFLAGFNGTSVGVCREEMLSVDLCALGVIEAHDVAVDVVVTESRVVMSKEDKPQWT